ncbi:hypothetical protein PHMEG_00016991 [Phytophthora megakarya]|uniref:Uncharacterized protein n=1 Tax=Phytophthora megakarya TaxID=4795 RepID=A0A225VXN5_9STRA|nr:hypothetical protein PHMEG_00016991 [Phytophthora megakarya]
MCVESSNDGHSPTLIDGLNNFWADLLSRWGLPVEEVGIRVGCKLSTEYHAPRAQHGMTPDCFWLMTEFVFQLEMLCYYSAFSLSVTAVFKTAENWSLWWPPLPTCFGLKD